MARSISIVKTSMIALMSWMMICSTAAWVVVPARALKTLQSPSPPCTGQCQKCVEQITIEPGCMWWLKTSAQARRVMINEGCCRAVTRLSEDCFKQVFSQPPFDLQFGAQVKDFCHATGFAPSPTSVTEISGSADLNLD